MHFMQLMTLDIGNDALLCKNIKLQENESLRDFMKRFEQVVLQVESCSMDAILQIFKQVDKYSMLEDDVQVATQQVLVTNLPTKDDKIGSSKPLNQSRQASKRRDDQQQQNQEKLTSVSISYERLLPMIHILSDIRWLESIKTDPTK
ncbi:hypothetical protein CK203_117078 [Vitis vinifera]|uniref:Retrotransposon gag domain-containing protein n=1 Tax=Vitis vinifera TaxID=29760 RepID=A0A438C877_VITVI|nr:hypothetical protein CK203_117078 [Vitis vinifera]